MNKYPPVLEVPISESARDLKEVTVTLLYDEPREFEGKYGTQYKYSVEVDGVEQTLFASAALNKKIQDHAPTKGTKLSLARFGSGKETKWDVMLMRIHSGGPQRPTMAATAPRSSEQGVAPLRTPQAFVEALRLYWDAFDLANTTLKQKGYEANVDANAIAFVIYKLAQDHGVTNVYEPIEPTATTTDVAEADGKSKMLTEITKGFQRTNLEEQLWLPVINIHNEGQEQYTSIDQMTREVGLTVWASIKNVESGVTTWGEFIVPEDLPF